MLIKHDFNVNSIFKLIFDCQYHFISIQFKSYLILYLIKVTFQCFFYHIWLIWLIWLIWFDWFPYLNSIWLLKVFIQFTELILWNSIEYEKKIMSRQYIFSRHKKSQFHKICFFWCRSIYCEIILATFRYFFAT